jgi:hypothetical protein
MLPVRVVISSFALVVALAPVVAFADHTQDELANAEAQLGLAEDEAAALQAQAQLDAANDRAIALAKSEADRLAQLSLTANGAAIEQIAHALANAARAQGDLNALNELEIAQARAAALVAKADATLANALAQGRPDEIANARAQSNGLHNLANLIDGAQAEIAMSSAILTGEARADAIHTPGIAAAANGQAMGANELLAADAALNAGDLAASNDMQIDTAKATAVIDHAEASLANAEAMAAAQD